MGTTLTGTTPQDTYDSLIKVTDNGPLSGSLKKLTDGLGNDSALSLSTGAASITGTLAVSGAVTTGTNTNVQATSTNTRLLVTAAGVANTVLGFNNSGSTENGVVNNAGYIGILQEYPFVVTIGDAERMRITAAGSVGIGTEAPTQKLSVVGGSIFTSRTDSSENIIISDGTVNSSIQQVTHLYLNSGGNSATFGDVVFRTKNSFTEMARFTQNGLCFNGDTAAANALDDYEEGTFTATLKGSVSDPTTPVTTTGTYTKIGRQVTVNVIFSSVNTTGASGAVSITGMPFTASGISNGAANCFQFTFPSNTSLASYIGASSTLVELLISGTNANWEDLTHSAGGSRFLWTTLTYFV
jgi:hypothetical protein